MRPSPAILRSVLALLACFTLAAPATARRHKVHRRHSIPTVAGLVVAQDPKTGALTVPTPAQRLELSAQEQSMLSRSSLGLVEHHYPNGMVGLDLGGRYQDFMMVQIAPDGTKRFRCLDDAYDVRNVLRSPPPAAPALEER